MDHIVFILTKMAARLVPVLNSVREYALFMKVAQGLVSVRVMTVHLGVMERLRRGRSCVWIESFGK